MDRRTNERMAQHLPAEIRQRPPSHRDGSPLRLDGKLCAQSTGQSAVNCVRCGRLFHCGAHLAASHLCGRSRRRRCCCWRTQLMCDCSATTRARSSGAHSRTRRKLSSSVRLQFSDQMSFCRGLPIRSRLLLRLTCLSGCSISHSHRCTTETIPSRVSRRSSDDRKHIAHSWSSAVAGPKVSLPRPNELDSFSSSQVQVSRR